MTRHNNILCIMALGLVAALTLCGCSESYPELKKEEVEIPIKDIINQEYSNVPIIPSMTDPQYEIFTRGMGAMGPWTTDKDKWTSARFHTFALLSETKHSQSSREGHTDYTVAESDTTHKLVWNQPMGIVANEEEKGLKFFDADDNEVTKWYHSTNETWKYKFATYFADGAEKANTLKGNSDNTVTVDVEIDGTQDVMHSFAYHTKEEQAKAFLNLNPENDDTDSILIKEGQELFYSTKSGSRAINPRFRINHLMTGIDFRIKGVKAKQGQTASYKDMVITKVLIESSYKAKMKVLDDKWDSLHYTNDLVNNKILVFDSDKKDFEMEILDNHDEFIKTVRNGVPFDDNYEEGSHHHHIINENAAEPLTKSILVAPTDIYKITVFYDFLTSSLGTKNKQVYYVHPPEGKEMFEAGHAYTIVINVYGVQTIDGSVSIKPWVEEFETDENGNVIDDSAINVGGDDNSEDWDIDKK